MANNDDRISSLPDSLLCHILSFLPTATSVATCVLSRRWRHLWEYLQVFDFIQFPEDLPASPHESSERFVDFVNKVLTLRRVRHIRKFCLACDLNDIHTHIATWIRAATGPHLEELDIRLCDEDSPSYFELPPSIFTCTGLVSLVLNGGMDLYKLSSVHLPSLKYLEVDIFCADPMDQLLSGCPALETLKLNFEGHCAPSMHMPSSLKSLTFTDDRGDEISDEIGDKIDFLEIHTPSLEYLSISLKTKCCRFSFSNLHNVEIAYLDFDPYDEHVEFLPKLLKALYRTYILILKDATTKCLLSAPVQDFPEFRYLSHLSLFIPYFDTRFLMDVLHRCHVLESFTLWKKNSQWRPQHYEPSVWTQPTTVPNCVISHLDFFKFGGYDDFADELAFAAYILERGLVLKTVKIYSNKDMDIEKKHQILKGLAEIPRGSNTCQLKFD